jgi:hypothetical protein
VRAGLTWVGVQGKKSGRIMPSVTKMTMRRQGSAMRHLAGLPLKNSVRARTTCEKPGGRGSMWWMAIGLSSTGSDDHQD